MVGAQPVTTGNDTNSAISFKTVKALASEPAFPFPGVYQGKLAHVRNNLYMKSLAVASFEIAKRGGNNFNVQEDIVLKNYLKL